MTNTVGAENVSVDGGVGVSARHRDIDVAAADSGRETTERHLDGGAVVGVGDQSVGQRVRAAVGGSGPPDAEVGQPGPAQVLDDGQRSCAQDFQRYHGLLLPVLHTARN